LSHTPGIIRATVNLASQEAVVEYLADLTNPEGLKKVIEALGYQVLSTGTEKGLEAPNEELREKGYYRLRKKFVISAILGGLVMLISMSGHSPSPALFFTCPYTKKLPKPTRIMVSVIITLLFFNKKIYL